MKIIRQELKVEVHTYAQRVGSGTHAHTIKPEEVLRRDPYVLNIEFHISAVYFYDTKTTTDQDGDTLSNNRVNVSGMFYFGGTLFTREEVTKRKDAENFLKVMDDHECDVLIKDRNSILQPFYPERDTIL